MYSLIASGRLSVAVLFPLGVKVVLDYQQVPIPSVEGGAAAVAVAVSSGQAAEFLAIIAIAGDNIVSM